MGDPKKQRKKYQGPGHPWQGDRISEERELLREYGLKNKKELWKVNSLLRNWRTQARSINSLAGKKRDAAEKILITKLQGLNLIKKDSHLDDVLSLTTRDLLERRLQTIVHKNGLSNSVRQSRQFIVHNKVIINGKNNSSPAQMLKSDDKIALIPGFTPVIKKAVKLEEEKKAISKEMDRVLPEGDRSTKEAETVVPEQRVEAVKGASK